MMMVRCGNVSLTRFSDGLVEVSLGPNDDHALLLSAEELTALLSAGAELDAKRCADCSRPASVTARPESASAGTRMLFCEPCVRARKATWESAVIVSNR